MISDSLSSYHRSFSSKKAFRLRSSYYNRELTGLNESSLCPALKAEVSSLRIATFVEEGRSRCSLFDKPSVEIPFALYHQARCRLLGRARSVKVTANPQFLGSETLNLTANKRATLLCYRLKNVIDCFIHLLSHPIFGTRDKSTRVSIDLTGNIFWLTVTYATHSLPLGPDLLKLGSNHTSTISFETAPIIPQEFQISSPGTEFEKTIFKMIDDLNSLDEKLSFEELIQIRE